MFLCVEWLAGGQDVSASSVMAVYGVQPEVLAPLVHWQPVVYIHSIHNAHNTLCSERICKTRKVIFVADIMLGCVHPLLLTAVSTPRQISLVWKLFFFYIVWCFMRGTLKCILCISLGLTSIVSVGLYASKRPCGKEKKTCLYFAAVVFMA